jgi:hypothetical protein
MSERTPLHETDDPLRQQLLAQYGAPAFIRRTRLVQGAFEEVLARCRVQRDGAAATSPTSLKRQRWSPSPSLALQACILRPLRSEDITAHLPPLPVPSPHHPSPLPPPAT